MTPASEGGPRPWEREHVRERLSYHIYDNSEVGIRANLPLIIPDETKLEELGVDSLATMNAVIGFEQEFDIEVPDEAFAESETFGDVRRNVEAVIYG